MKYLLFTAILVSACSATKQTKAINPFSGDQVGCGDFIVYKFSEDNKQLVSITLDMTAIEAKASQSYGIDKAEVIDVKWKVYDNDVRPSICNDTRVTKPKELRNTRATSGLAHIYINETQLGLLNDKKPYRVTVVLKKVAFDGLFIDHLRIENVRVGWLPDRS